MNSSQSLMVQRQQPTRSPPAILTNPQHLVLRMQRRAQRCRRTPSSAGAWLGGLERSTLHATSQLCNKSKLKWPVHAPTVVRAVVITTTTTPMDCTCTWCGKGRGRNDDGQFPCSVHARALPIVFIPIAWCFGRGTLSCPHTSHATLAVAGNQWVTSQDQCRLGRSAPSRKKRTQ